MPVRILFSIIAGTVWMAASAAAQSTLGKFENWTAYVSKESDGKTCLAAAEPIKSAYSQPIKGRNPVVFMVARFPGNDPQNEPSMTIGYEFADNAKAKVGIDGEAEFTMFTEDDLAWVTDNRDDALVDAMRKGTLMVVEGRSKRGTVTKDTYSLAGVTAAVEAITKACP